MISLIAAAGEKNEIGKNGRMPWNLPGDLRHFKDLTLGKTMLMGRKTFQSLPGVLPKRQHIIVTRDADFCNPHPRVQVISDLTGALQRYEAAEEEIFVIGGGQIYEAAMPYASVIYLTRIHKNYDADAFFPEISPEQWMIADRGPSMEEQDTRYELITYRRRELPVKGGERFR